MALAGLLESVGFIYSHYTYFMTKFNVTRIDAKLILRPSSTPLFDNDT